MARIGSFSLRSLPTGKGRPIFLEFAAQNLASRLKNQLLNFRSHYWFVRDILQKSPSRSLHRLFFLLIMAYFGPGHLSAQTRIVRNGQGFSLLRNGSYYYVKGVGGTVQLDLAVAIGANSIRTWGIEQAQEILDEAHKRGLSVMLGFWLQHERHGFNYSDTAKVAKQFRHFSEAILRFKDHPALLMWGIGNELDLYYTNPACWDAVQQLAQFAHRVDPNHPTATVTAGLDSMDVQWILKKAPDIDLLGINTYGDIGGVPQNIQRYGWNGPYMITEWGPNGYWEAPQTAWKAAIEQSSSEKKQVYLDRYRNYIAPYMETCLGSYAFLWGAKQEYTETWFGLFSKDGLPTEPVDALQLVFTGKMPQQTAPGISTMKIEDIPAGEMIIKAGNRYKASVEAGIGAETGLMADSQKLLRYSWKILEESNDKKSGGDAELAAIETPTRIKNRNKSSIEFYAPAKEGAYRLFVQVYANGKVAYHNLPFRVESRKPEDGQARWIEWKPQHMNSFHE